MAHLKVIKESVTVQELDLDPQQTYLAGRGETCQIPLDPEPGISRHHLQIACTKNGWKLEVLSRYGELYVDGQKAPGITMTTQTKFSVPPYDFEFSTDGSEFESAGDGQSDLERTVVSILPSAAYLKLVDATGKVRQVFRLEGEAWIGGRDVTSNLFIDNPKISRKQFELYREGESYYIRDMGSSNGTLVNGQGISQNEWTQLDSGDVITVVDWTLQFELKDASFQDRISAVEAHLQGASIIDQEAPSFESDFGQVTNYGSIPNEQELPPPPGVQNDFSGDSSQGTDSPDLQFTTYDQQMPPPPNSPLGFAEGNTALGAEGQISSKNKFSAKLNPVRIIILLLIVGAGIYAFMENSTTDEVKPAAVKQKNPFDNLSPEDQQMVMQAYKAANTRMERREFAEALQEIARIKEKIPVYEESNNLEKTAKAGLAQMEDIKREEQLEKEKAEMEEKIQKQVAECQKQLDPKTSTVESVESCLAPVIPLNPEHPAIVSLKAQVEKFATDKKISDEKKKEHSEDVAKLRALYEKAVAIEKRENLFDAIKAYENVEHSKHTDPGGLKAKATRARVAIITKMAKNQKELEEQADQFTKEGKFREAVIALKKALKINPDNEVVKGHLAQSMLDLHKQLQVVYQESILDESVGDVETAKGKWKKIIDQSLSGEDYFEKARFKLKKYGVL